MLYLRVSKTFSAGVGFAVFARPRPQLVHIYVERLPRVDVGVMSAVRLPLVFKWGDRPYAMQNSSVVIYGAYLQGQFKMSFSQAWQAVIIALRTGIMSR